MCIRRDRNLRMNRTTPSKPKTARMRRKALNERWKQTKGATRAEKRDCWMRKPNCRRFRRRRPPRHPLLLLLRRYCRCCPYFRCRLCCRYPPCCSNCLNCLRSPYCRPYSRNQIPGRAERMSLPNENLCRSPTWGRRNWDPETDSRNGTVSYRCSSCCNPKDIERRPGNSRIALLRRNKPFPYSFLPCPYILGNM